MFVDRKSFTLKCSKRFWSDLTITWFFFISSHEWWCKRTQVPLPQRKTNSWDRCWWKRKDVYLNAGILNGGLFQSSKSHLIISTQAEAFVKMEMESVTEIGEGNGKRSSEKGDHWKGRGAEGLGICHFSSFLPSFWNFLQTRICRFTVDTCGSSWLVPSSPFSPGTSLSCKKRVDKERKHRALFTHLKKTEGWLQPWEKVKYTAFIP